MSDAPTCPWEIRVEGLAKAFDGRPVLRGVDLGIAAGAFMAVVMLHEGRVSFDGSFEEFKASDSPIIRPYFELMPVLHQRENR